MVQYMSTLTSSVLDISQRLKSVEWDFVLKFISLRMICMSGSSQPYIDRIQKGKSIRDNVLKRRPHIFYDVPIDNELSP